MVNNINHKIAKTGTCFGSGTGSSSGQGGTNVVSGNGSNASNGPQGVNIQSAQNNSKGGLKCTFCNGDNHVR